MRRLLFTAAAMLVGCTACLAQVSTMGSTAMGLSSTPGAIVTSPLNGPGPFSATTQPGTPVTTLAPVPLASDPTTPGTVVTCSTPSGQITPGTAAVPVTSLSAVGGAAGTPASAAPTMPAVTASTAATAAPTPSTIPNTVSPSMTGSTATMTPSATTMSSMATMSSTALGTIPTPIVGSTTGTISPVSPVGSSSTTVCSSTPGGPPTNGAALPLSTPAIPASPPPGTIQQDVTQLGATSIDPTMTVMPTPNTSACAESVTMNLSTPGTMAPANATGAAATPGVSPASPSGC